MILRKRGTKTVLKEQFGSNVAIALYCLVLVMLFFGVDYIQEFSVDTYATYTTSQWRHMLYDNARVVSAVVYWVIEKLDFSSKIVYLFSWVSAVFFLSAAVFVLAKMIQKMTDNIMLCVGIAFLSVANFFIIDYFLFIEKGLFMLALLLNVLAVYFWEKSISIGDKRQIVMAFLFLLFAVFIYQMSLGLFVVLSLPFIIRNSKGVRNILRHTVEVATLYGLNMVIALIAAKLVGSGRLITSIDMVAAIKHTLKLVKYVSINDSMILPKGFMFLVLVIITLMAVILCLIYSQKKLKAFIELLFIIFGCYIVGFMPYFTGIASGYAPRILYPFASILGVLLIYYYVEMFDKNKLGYGVLCICSSLLLFVQYFSFTEIFIERYKVNQTDKYIAEMIEAQIEEYELETNETIQYVTFYTDQSITYCFPDLNTSRFLTLRAHVTTWSDINMLNYYLGTFYKKGETDPRFEEYFSKYDWNTFSEEQLIFNGDTLHICVY